MCQWTNEWMIKWTKKWMSEWTKQMKEWMSKRKNERMSQWKSEQVDDQWTNIQMKESMNEGVSKWDNEQMNEWMNEWANEQMNGSKCNKWKCTMWLLLVFIYSYKMSNSFSSFPTKQENRSTYNLTQREESSEKSTEVEPRHQGLFPPPARRGSFLYKSDSEFELNAPRSIPSSRHHSFSEG